MPTPEALKELDIVITGAGPAGLAAARLRHLAGVGVRVFERDADRSARTQGGTLDLGEDGGLRVLAAAGLAGEFTRFARPQGQRNRRELLGVPRFEGRARFSRVAVRSLVPAGPALARQPSRAAGCIDDVATRTNP
ncbi:FAD-dependent monooxygenase [Amycolatopsis carbonis]|uniref:FAD-dependent monooxygenase n=1 Tax=Amycolatopsis carbonis TaxID=715471 RepID=A0A9Y2N0D8_9PSEU|nr:FAD-dependent monooxygenase [Amycolatopsis sp. 2-15]WIX83573.1 FAD-dependent monooxygenase [Amycolatopsis sp. 2-15]